MTKFDKTMIVLSAIDAGLAVAHIAIGEHPVLAAALSAAASAGITQVLCNVNRRKLERQNQALELLLDEALDLIVDTIEEAENGVVQDEQATERVQ